MGISRGTLYASVPKSDDDGYSVVHTIVNDLEKMIESMGLENDDANVKVLAPNTRGEYPIVVIDKGFYAQYGNIDCSMFLSNYYETPMENYFWQQVYDNMGKDYVSEYSIDRYCYSVGIVIESSDARSMLEDIKEDVLDAVAIEGIEVSFVTEN